MAPHEPSAQQQVAAASQHLAALAQSELRLARAEIGQGVRSIGTGLFLGAFAVVFGLLALGVLSFAGVAWLVTERGLSAWVAASVVGGVHLCLAVVCALVARRKTDVDRLTPRRSLANVKRDFESLKEILHG